MVDSGSADKLRALVQLLSQSVEDVIDEYTKAGQPVPSLDSLESGPFDALETSTDKLAKAVKVIQGACAQLAATVPGPGKVIQSKALSYLEPACLQLVTSVKIADHLDGNPSGLTLDELAKKSGVDKEKLGRILRYLATNQVFCETSPNVFCNNRLSLKLRSPDPVASLVGHLTDEVMQASANLSETLTDPEFGHSNQAEHTAFKKRFDRGLIEFYLSEEGREAAMRCSRAMVGASLVAGTLQSVLAYPWGELSADTRVCDFGGGNGHVMLEVIKRNTGLRVVIQDMPPVLEGAKHFWQATFPAAMSDQRVEFIGFNFFEEKPRDDCDVFYLRCVIHDWPDSKAAVILSNVRGAMSPNKRLLLHEYVLQASLKDTKALADKAPEPLLPNYGAGGIGAYHSDLVMMGCLNSRERSLDEYIHLCSQAKFKFVKAWGTGDMQVMEFAPV